MERALSALSSKTRDFHLLVVVVVVVGGGGGGDDHRRARTRKLEGDDQVSAGSRAVVRESPRHETIPSDRRPRRERERKIEREREGARGTKRKTRPSAVREQARQWRPRPTLIYPSPKMAALRVLARADLAVKVPTRYVLAPFVAQVERQAER